jgi:hypothetical protein
MSKYSKTKKMKSNIIKIGLLAAVGFGAFTACENDDRFNNPIVEGACITETPTTTVAALYASAPASSTDIGAVQAYGENDDIIEAYVTSSDEGGTFYKSLSMQTLDGTLAFSIPVDMYNVYTEFEPGRKVYVHLKGRSYNQTYGSLLIGDVYNDPDTPDLDQIGRLVPEEFRRTLKASCEKVDEEQLVQHLSVSEALTDANINKLIEFDNVQFSDDSFSGEQKTYFQTNNQIGGATNLHLVDADGHSIIFRTSSFAKFAGKRVNTGNGKVRGVLTKYRGDYQFLARTEADIQLTNPRAVPVFEESFSNNFPLWTKFSVIGASQNWVLDTQFGNPGSCAKMSGFQSGNQNNEDWLISPAIDLSGMTSATLSFDTATKFAGNQLQVLISTDYSGTGTPVGATWTPVTGATLSPSSGSYIWTASGALDISDFAGQTIRIAYKYTSTTAAAATWEVDNVKVIAQ